MGDEPDTPTQTDDVGLPPPPTGSGGSGSSQGEDNGWLDWPNWEEAIQGIFEGIFGTTEDPLDTAGGGALDSVTASAGDILSGGSLDGLGGGIASGVAGAVGGGTGQVLGNALFGQDAEDSYGAGAGTLIGSAIGGPVGAAIGGIIGGIADAAMGTSDQKNVTVGVATGKPGDNIIAETTGASGLTFYTVGQRTDDAAAMEYTDALLTLDQYLTDLVGEAGFDIVLDSDTFNDPAGQADVKNLMNNATFFGSATEGSKETTQNAVEDNLTAGLHNFTASWIQAASEQLGADQQAQVSNLLEHDGWADGSITTEGLLEYFRQIMAGEYVDWVEPIESRVEKLAPVAGNNYL